jgi:hypothetical protein
MKQAMTRHITRKLGVSASAVFTVLSGHPDIVAGSLPRAECTVREPDRHPCTLTKSRNKQTQVIGPVIPHVKPNCRVSITSRITYAGNRAGSLTVIRRSKVDFDSGKSNFDALPLHGAARLLNRVSADNGPAARE